MDGDMQPRPREGAVRFPRVLAPPFRRRLLNDNLWFEPRSSPRLLPTGTAGGISLRK